MVIAKKHLQAAYCSLIIGLGNGVLCLFVTHWYNSCVPVFFRLGAQEDASFILYFIALPGHPYSAKAKSSGPEFTLQLYSDHLGVLIAHYHEKFAFLY